LSRTASTEYAGLVVSCVGGADKHTIGCSILHMCGLVNVCLCAAVHVLATAGRCCNIHSSAPHARDWLPVACPQALAAPAGWLGSETGCRTDLVLSCSGVPWAAVYWKVYGGGGECVQNEQAWRGRLFVFGCRPGLSVCCCLNAPRVAKLEPQ
jgi:hypothetical protein